MSRRSRGSSVGIRADRSADEALYKGAHSPGGQAINIAFSTDSVTPAMGHTAGGIALILLLKSKYSGIFKWKLSGQQPAAAATETVTWTVTTQTGVASPTFTSNGNGDGAFTPGSLVSALPSGQVLIPTAAGGIVIATGLGGSVSQALAAETLGTLAVGSAFSASGTLWNSSSAANLALGNPIRSTNSFPLGNWVALLLSITNSATDRVVNSICGEFEEIRGN